MVQTTENYIREIANQIRKASGSTNLALEGIDELFDIYAVLAMAKGCDVTDEDIHDAWSAWATKHSPNDDSIIPFDELSTEIQALDSKYTKAIHSVACTLPEFEAKN